MGNQFRAFRNAVADGPGTISTLDGAWRCNAEFGPPPRSGQAQLAITPDFSADGLDS